MMLNVMKIDKNRAEFERVLVESGFSEEQAAEFRQDISRDEDGGLTNAWQEDTTADFLGPGCANKNHRSNRAAWQIARPRLVEAGFYQDDLATTLIAYTDMAVRRGVWQNRFAETDFRAEQRAKYEAVGMDGQWNLPVANLMLQIKEAQARGQINDAQYNRIVFDILPAYAGQLGLRTNARLRKLSSTLVIYQNLRLLSFALFSSFVDVGTLIARNPAWQDANTSLKTLLDRQSREDTFTMLEAIGAMREGLTEHVLNDQTLNTFMTGRAKRINDLFFRYNQMESWTNLMRAMALVSGREFMKRHAQQALGGGNATSQRYLDELDITPAEVLAWDGQSTGNQRVNAALNRYIDEAMIRPDAPIRPVWMSDPGYGIFAHLKGFLWGFHETFLRRVSREARIHQNLLPAVTLGLLALPFAVVGYELRRKLTGSKQAPQGFDYFQEVVERSGLPGAFQVIVDMEQADEHGKPWGLAIGGPTVEHFYDLVTSDDFDKVLSRSTPVVAQVPPLRQWVQDTF
jgi:hypothetical protein